MIDSYNLEIKDEDGFVGDKASRGAFHAMLEKWREPLRELGVDPLGERHLISCRKKQLDKMLSEGDPGGGRHRPQRGRGIRTNSCLRHQALPQDRQLA